MSKQNFIIHTKNRTSQSDDPSSCRLALVSQGYTGKYFLEKVVIPYSWYNVDSTNNVFYIYDNNTSTYYTISLASSGNYTIDTFISALQTAIRSATSNNNYTVSYSSTTYKITIACTTTFKVMNASYETNNNAITLSRISGFVTDSSALATSQTGNACFNMVRDKFVSLYLSVDTSVTYDYVDDKRTKGSCLIPVAKLFGEVIHWEPRLNIDIAIASDSQLYIALFHEDGSVCSTNGVDFCAILKKY